MESLKDYFTTHNLIAVILGIVGLVWLVHTVWKNMKINKISTWPKINATVVNALVEPANKSAGNTYIDPKFIVATVDGSAQYIPVVLYTYRVGGKEYQSKNFSYYGPQTYNALDMKTMMGPFYPGATIQVFYNPSNPAESYVYNGKVDHTGVVLSVILLLIAAYIAYRHNNKTSFKSKAYDDISLTELETRPISKVTFKKNVNSGNIESTRVNTAANTVYRRDIY